MEIRKVVIFLFLLAIPSTLLADDGESWHKKAYNCYLFNRYGKALEYWNQAKELGYADAYYYIAMCYDEGKGVSVSKDYSLSLIKQGAEEGSALAMNKLGEHYRSEKDYEKSFALFEKAAKKGNDEAQVNLAKCYHLGMGVDRNLYTAAVWYRVSIITKEGPWGDYDGYVSYSKLAADGYCVPRETAAAFIANQYMDTEEIIRDREAHRVNHQKMVDKLERQAGEAYICIETKENLLLGKEKNLVVVIDGEEVKLSSPRTRILVTPKKEIMVFMATDHGSFISSPRKAIFISIKSGQTVYLTHKAYSSELIRTDTGRGNWIACDVKSAVRPENGANTSSGNILLASAAPTPATHNSVATPATPSEPRPGTIPVSDVDTSIPEASSISENTFAVIIANENYSAVSKVDFALNDGSTFSRYCNRTLGLPQKHIILCKDATYGAMELAISRIESIGSAYDGNLNIIFYYAGHGIPDEKTRDSFLIPVDGDGSALSTCFRTSSVYKRLSGINARSVIVFMDACFSGSVRGEGMLASARGVRIAAKDEVAQGKMVVLSAAHGDQTAYPYTEKGHGMFTYFLLKKLQATSGNVSLGDLSDYITMSVKQESVVSCGRIQTPTTTPSSEAAGWREWKFR